MKTPTSKAFDKALLELEKAGILGRDTHVCPSCGDQTTPRAKNPGSTKVHCDSCGHVGEKSTFKESSWIAKSKNSPKGIIGKTRSGKPVFFKAGDPRHSGLGYTAEDHEDAAGVHKEQHDGWASAYRNAIGKQTIEQVSQLAAAMGHHSMAGEQHLKVAKAMRNGQWPFGEGSKGGKVLGHTRSGKPIYAHTGHRKIHQTYDVADHIDAAKAHLYAAISHRSNDKKGDQHFDRASIHASKAARKLKREDKHKDDWAHNPHHALFNLNEKLKTK